MKWIWLFVVKVLPKQNQDLIDTFYWMTRLVGVSKWKELKEIEIGNMIATILWKDEVIEPNWPYLNPFPIYNAKDPWDPRWTRLCDDRKIMSNLWDEICIHFSFRKWELSWILTFLLNRFLRHEIILIRGHLKAFVKTWFPLKNKQ